MNQNKEWHSQPTLSNDQTDNTLKEAERREVKMNIHNTHLRSKSADYLQHVSTAMSSLNTRSATIHVDKIHSIHNMDYEKRELTALNNHFEKYLSKIKTLADMNIKLRRKILLINQTYMDHSNDVGQTDNQSRNSLETQYINLRRQLNNELGKLVIVVIRLQRADYDTKYYKNKVQLFSETDRNQILEQQLNANLYELNLLKQQYEKQDQELQLCKKQYNDYLRILIQCADEYSNVTFQRMQTENSVFTLKEQLLFERAFNQLRQQEMENFEKIQYDLNQQFNETELKNMLENIRQDYQRYNQIQLSELEMFYQIKLDSMKNNYQVNEKENYSDEIKQLTEQNQLLRQKLRTLQNNYHQIVEENRQQYERSYDEYQRLDIQASDLESSILDSRNNTIYLSSEIKTYECLLMNLASSSQDKPKPCALEYQTNNLTVHFKDGLMFVRI